MQGGEGSCAFFLRRVHHSGGHSRAANLVPVATGARGRPGCRPARRSISGYLLGYVNLSVEFGLTPNPCRGEEEKREKGGRKGGREKKDREPAGFTAAR